MSDQEIQVLTALASLREIRAKRKEEMVLQADLLAKGYEQLKAFLDKHPLADPLTAGPMLSLDWKPVSDRGCSLTVKAFGSEYGVSLEVHYEHGGALVFGAGRTGDARERAISFRESVFRGDPLRLENRDGEVVIVRRIPNGTEHHFALITLLATFANAIQLRITHDL